MALRVKRKRIGKKYLFIFTDSYVEPKILVIKK